MWSRPYRSPGTAAHRLQAAVGRCRRGRSAGLPYAGLVRVSPGNHLTPEEHVLEIWFGIFPLRVSWPLLLMVAGGYIAWRERFATPERG